MAPNRGQKTHYLRWIKDDFNTWIARILLKSETTDSQWLPNIPKKIPYYALLFFLCEILCQHEFGIPLLKHDLCFLLHNTEAQGQLSCFHLKNTPRSIATCENWSKNCYGMLRTGASLVAHLQWNPSLGSTRHGEPQPLKANRCMPHWEDDSESENKNHLNCEKQKTHGMSENHSWSILRCYSIFHFGSRIFDRFHHTFFRVHFCFPYMFFYWFVVLPGCL